MATPTDKELLAFAQELATLAAREDVLLLDLGAGIAPATVLTMLAADWIVLVTQPEIAALVDAYAIVKCTAQLNEHAKFLVVVNRVGTPGRGELAFQRLTEVARAHVGVQLHYLGEITDNPAVSHRRLGQPPLIVSHEECNESKAIRSILNGLEVAAGPLVAGMPAEGLEQRLMQRLRGR
jgi:flagellar biosynthesis protein FlhG